MASRSILNLDGDWITREFLDDFEAFTPYTSCLYTTHSSTPENPRARLLFPLTRDGAPEEYVAVSRYLAQMLGIVRWNTGAVPVCYRGYDPRGWSEFSDNSQNENRRPASFAKTGIQTGY